MSVMDDLKYPKSEEMDKSIKIYIQKKTKRVHLKGKGFEDKDLYILAEQTTVCHA